MKVYMDSFANQIVTREEAQKRLFDDAQEFEWENAIAAFSWDEIKAGLTDAFAIKVEEQYRTIYFPQRFTEYEIYGDDDPEDENGELTSPTEPEPDVPEGSE